MAGYIHDPNAIINLIADNLRDRYKSGFPVLKEIIQNADDAGSAGENIHLEFGLSAGLANAGHPLLKGPALYFLNNGAFSDSDYNAIRSFGLNRKAIEQSSIGKFGLGMKSVFHFCEAFFFLAKNIEREYTEILNPWTGEGFPSIHDVWNDFSPLDANLVRVHLQPVLDRMDLSRGSFFLLWLPLRKESHLVINGQKVGSIISEFPGDNDKLLAFLFQQDLAQKLASLLPLLRRINSIRFWHANDVGSTASPIFKVSLQAGASRIIGLADKQYPVRDLEGVVSYQREGRDKTTYSLGYSGQERQLDIPELLSLRQSSFWPKSYVLERDENGLSKEAPDKSLGHSAVVFSRSNEKETGRLKVRWAVFLPVDAAKEEVPCGGDSCYRLTIHGCFFVDAGRVIIEGLQDGVDPIDAPAKPQNEVELRRAWNIRLAHLGTLPLILPALEAFIGKANLASDEIWQLSDGISKSKLFHRYRESICSKSSWVCCLTRKGLVWCSLASDKILLPLPIPPLSAPERPWTTLPALKELESRGISLVLNSAPHLLLAKSLPQWNETRLLEILHLSENEVFADQGSLDYLLTFLGDPACRPFLKMGSLQQILQEIASRAFVSLGTALRQNRKKVQDFVGFVLPESRYPVMQDNHLVLRELQQCKIGALVLAKEFDAADIPGTARLSLSDALVLLQKLHDLISRYEQQNDQESLSHCRAIARDILQNQDDEQRRALLVKANILKILEGYDCIKKKPIALSPAEVIERSDARLLFLYSQGLTLGQRLGLAPKLQMAIIETVILINSKTAELVFGQRNDLVPCQADSVLDALGTESKPLQSIEHRRQLLPEVAGADLTFLGRVKGLRYLLHGLEDHFGDEATLWVAGYDQSPVWEKLWQQLESHNEDGWNLIARKLVEAIPQDKWPKLSIREIKPKDILEELRQQGLEGVEGEQFTPDERDTVLQELERDEDLWKRLPFHETVNGNLVIITPEKSYLESDITLPAELLDHADIIRRSNDQIIRRQQHDWLMPLSREGVVTIALQHGEPTRFWRLLMDNLDPEGNAIESSLLRDTAWLLDMDGKPVKPADVIYLENMQDEVDRLLVKARGAYWSPGKLHADIQEHPSFNNLASCFASDRDGFAILGQLLGETEEYHVGLVKIPDDDFTKIVKSCTRLPANLHMPGWTLLASALDTSFEWTKEYLFQEMAKQISPARIIDVLNWLHEEHGRVGKGVKIESLAAFNTYLAALVNERGGAASLADLFLLNREGAWKAAKDLCADAEGVADSNLLDDEQKRLLHEIISRADRQQATADDLATVKRNLQPEIRASADTLAAFFAEWEGLVSPEIICAFLSLLGDDPQMLELAERYRGSHSVDWVRNKIPWKVHLRIDELNRQEWMYGLDQYQALAQHRFIVHCSEGEMVTLCSILGESIDVPLKSRFTSLISGGLFYESPDGQINNVRITLRKPRIEDAAPTELSGFLRSSAEYLLNKAYNQRDCNLAQLWEDLDSSKQLDIRIAQQMVLNHIPFYLRQLGVHKHPRLQELLHAWDEAARKREEYYEEITRRDRYERDGRQLLENIKGLLKTDEEVQSVVLDAVRDKMRDYQYTTASIPFELFQNADDAVVELAAIKAYPRMTEEIGEDLIPDDVRRFLVNIDEDSLIFVHWGRPVNAEGSGGFPGRERGFHHDLEKMLVLSSSDKSPAGKVTGKFGLGFKSVLLATDRPKLLSGQLATEIIAGLCPIPLNDSAILRGKLKGWYSDRRWPGTLIELPLAEKRSQQIMESFSQLAGFMTIFAKQIRRIDIHGSNEQSWEWIPEKIPLSETACLEFGELLMPVDSLQKGFSLYFRLAGGGILVGLGPEGFRPLPAELPAIWVVAPTKEREGLGFAINGLFDLDAGRARLAGNSAVNGQKALDLGRSFGKALMGLHRLTTEQWGVLKSRLRLEQDLSLYGFWATFWKVMSLGGLSRESDEVSSLVNCLLCNDSGLGYLLSHVDTLPNGLWGEYQSLTQPGKIRVVLKGSLSLENIFKMLSEWEFFRALLGTPDGVVTDQIFLAVRKVVPALGQTTTQWRSLYLADVLHEFLKTEKNATPGTARALGQLLNPVELKHEDFEKERESIKKALTSFSFKSQDGAFNSANELLVQQKHTLANPDEANRAAFAPGRNVLSLEYQGTGLDFFFACREKISLPVEEMAKWIVDAPDELIREKGLRYLLEGEHGEKVAQRLRENGLEGTWLKELTPASACILEWTETDKIELLFRKLPSTAELHEANCDQQDAFNMAQTSISPPDPQVVLNRIWEWWDRNKENYLKEYEKKTYPGGFIHDLAENSDGRFNRSAWLILFVLGHCHTMGRHHNYQHKGFIDLCMRKDWWRIFSAEKPANNSDEWMRVLDEYIEEQTDSSQYEHWMNRFPAIYRIARGLDDYRELLLGLDRYQELNNIRVVLQPRANPVNQGGGISAPPIDRTLGIGACFAIRELKRQGLLRGRQIDPYCYVPVRRVRELCSTISQGAIVDEGLTGSTSIHGFLSQHLGEQKATFHDCFDIPLQIISEDKDLFSMMLRQETI